jgi:hypothetical protein
MLEELQDSRKVTMKTQQAGFEASPLNSGERVEEKTFRGGLIFCLFSGGTGV